MKAKQKQSFLSELKSSTNSSKGFALISTILIMSLLMLISVGMLSMSSITTTTVSITNHSEIAHANARLAAMRALGKLQLLAGPDTRTTANVSVTVPNSANKYWVSVYDTQVGEDVDASEAGDFVVNNLEDKRYLTDSREDSALVPIGRLVSGEVEPSVVLSDQNSIVMLETGDPETQVRAPLEEIGDSALAYWVADNSVKALYKSNNPYSAAETIQADGSQESFYNGAVSQGSNLDEMMFDGDNLFDGQSVLTADQIDKGVSLDTAQLMFDGVTYDNINNIYHSVTGESASVFSNPQVGGLKRDLTPFLELGDMVPSGATDASLGLESLLEDNPIIKGDHHNMTSPRFGVLKDWADLRFKLDADSGAATIEAQSSEDSFMQIYDPLAFNSKHRDLTKHKTNYIQPVVVEASLGWDFSPYAVEDGENLRLHIIPRLILWNPFNVSIKSENYVMMIKLPRTGAFHYRNTKLMNAEKTEDQSLYFENIAPGKFEVGFVTGQVILQPGECKVFSPDIALSGGPNIAGITARYEPDDYSANVLSADGTPGVKSFYQDSARELTAETPGNKFAPYGFGSAGNSFYADYGQSSDEFMVLQTNLPSSGPINKSTLASSTEYDSIAHFLANSYCQAKHGKWYAAELSDHASNGNPYFRDVSTWSLSRLAPRLWRRGVRMLWYNEQAEASSHAFLNNNPSRLNLPLVAATNLRGGLYYHPSAHGAANSTGWEFPHMDSHIYLRQPTDPAEFENFVPSSPIGKPSDGFPTRVVLYDIPREKSGIFTLGQFQSAQFSYLPWHPSYILGSSYSTDQSDLDATALRSGNAVFDVKDSNRWSSPMDGKYSSDSVMQRSSTDSAAQRTHDDEVLIYDISYELNHSLWDRYMISGIRYGSGEIGRSVSWDGETDLPISSYKPRSTADYSKEDIVSEIEANSSFLHYHAAEFLLNEGALNVNCDNKEVWKALLMSLYDKNRPNLQGDSKESDTAQYSRNILPWTAGSGSISSSAESKAWSGFRALTGDEIDTLAEKIVEQVRLRGPFVSMSDFINRRLTLENDELSRAGTLQAAIDATQINANIEQPGNYDGDLASEVPSNIATISHRVDYKTAGLPGYFSQNDLLTVLGSSLTARGDTFTIRAYGSSSDASGKLMAEAYCEVLVQRCPEYVDSTDSAIEPVRVYDEVAKEWVLNTRVGGVTVGKGLSDINLKLGRKFKILSFKWIPKPS